MDFKDHQWQIGSVFQLVATLLTLHGAFTKFAVFCDLPSETLVCEGIGHFWRE